MESFWRSLGTQPIIHYKPGEQQRAWAAMLDQPTSISWLLPPSASEGEPVGGLAHIFALRLE